MPDLNVGEQNSGRIDLYYKHCGDGFSQGLPLTAATGQGQSVSGFSWIPLYRTTGAAMAHRGTPERQTIWTITPTTLRRSWKLDLKNAIHVGHTRQERTPEGLSGVTTSCVSDGQRPS